MANFEMGKIGDYLKAFQTYFKRNRRGNRTTDEEEAEKDREAQEFAGDAQDDAPGNVRLNSGQHKQVFGIRKKLIGVVILFFVLAFAGGYLMTNDADEKTAQKPRPASKASETTQPSRQGEEASKTAEMSYQDLRALDQKNGAKNQAARPPAAQTTGAGNLPGTDPAMGNVQNSNEATLRAIQQAQRSPSVAVPSPAVPAAGNSGESAQAAAAQREEQALEDRYKSAIAFALGQGTLQGTAAASTPAAAGTTESGMGLALPSETTEPNANTVQSASLSYTSGNPYVLQAGTLIPAMLFSGINTDTPGAVTAQVSADVYDSLTHGNLLIPAGSRLIGTYSDAGTENGRVSVTFNSLILPNGNTYDIGSSMTAVDGGGYNGIAGKVNRHTMRVMGAGFLSSAIAALGSIASGNSAGQASYTGGQIAMQGAMANLIQSASGMISRAASARPTVTVDPGHTFQIYVKQPIAFGAASF